jgi:predicted DNA-binding transcriptional regulator AlpA
MVLSERHKIMEKLVEAKKSSTARNATLREVLAISAKDLAEMLSLSPRSIWRLVSSGRLPKMVSIGGSKRFLMSDVNLYIECGCDMTRFEAMREAQQ